MSDLEPCPGCRRHVRVDEAACPFCGGAIAVSGGAPRTLGAGRLTRAAVFAGAAATAIAGCGGKQKTDGTGTGTGSENVENTVVDAGPGEVVAPPDAAPYVEPPDHNIPMPYGAPPARTRMV
jgi:hypothetical protein